MRPPASLPMQILINPGQITILFEEFNDFRIIHIDQKTHPEDPDPSFFGHQIGHWEGDTLVVDSVGFTDETVIDSVGMPHSDAMHIVEWIRRTGPGTLEDVMTITDPKAFTRPWTTVSSYRRVAGVAIQEYHCENDRNVPDAHGATGVQMPAGR